MEMVMRFVNAVLSNPGEQIDIHFGINISENY
jgi:hypothetical protein